MTDPTFYDTIAPVINILGGVAGLTILYFIIIVLHNHRKLKELKSINLRMERVERMTRDLWINWMRAK